MSEETIVLQMKRRIREAMKAKNDLEKEILRVALGEIETAGAREGGTQTDADAIAIIRKLVKANDETAAASADPATKDQLAKENAILQTLLPQTLSPRAIADLLAEQAAAIKAAPNDGAATGVAMKALKAKNASVTGKDVAEAVKLLRA